MDEKLEIGLKIKQFAKKNFGSVTALAQKIGKTPQYFSTYINGRSYPGGELLAELYELGCDLNWLLNIKSGADEMNGGKIAEPYPKYSIDERLEKLENEIQKLKANNYDLIETCKTKDEQIKNLWNAIEQIGMITQIQNIITAKVDKINVVREHPK